MKVVPELLCSDINNTKAFYTDVLGFKVKYQRPEDRFVYFTRDGVDVMCEEIMAPGRRWITGEMEQPYGRGINLQWQVDDVTALYQRIESTYPEVIYMKLEVCEYKCGAETVRQTQFIVKDPDGYLFRFCD